MLALAALVAGKQHRRALRQQQRRQQRMGAESVALNNVETGA